MGISQIGKAEDSESLMYWFESSIPNQIFIRSVILGLIVTGMTVFLLLGIFHLIS